VPSVNAVWGTPDWVSRVAKLTDRLLQSSAANLSPNDNTQRLGRQSLRNQSSKMNVNDLKTTSQAKLLYTK